MKLLVFGSVYPRHDSDSEVPWLRETVQRLHSAGIDVEVMAPSWRGLKSHQIDSIRVRRFRYAPVRWEWLTHDEGAPSKVAKSFWMRVIALFYLICGTVALFRIVRREQYDLIHVHWPFPHALMAYPTKLLLHKKLILNFHGAELLLVRKFPWVAPLLRFAIRRADGIIANSSFTAEKVKSLSSCHVQVIPYGSTLRNGAKRATPFTSLPWRILFVGRHIERKGITYLIESLAHLKEREKWQLRIVGEGDLTQQLQQQANSSPYANQILFTGKLTTQELEAEYSAASLFVLPAIVDSKGDTEGLGVVLIEAVETGLPLVASRVGGIVDVVLDGESGLLVDEKNPAQLAAAFERLSEDPDLRVVLTQQAEKRCAQFFNWERVVQELIALYRQTLNSSAK